jgi:hypothetical protein
MYITRRSWNFSKWYGRQIWWHGKSTCMTKFWRSDLFTVFTGMRFGLMQVKTGLCYILSRFEVAPCKDTSVHIAFDPKSFVLQTIGDMLLSFKRINFWSNVQLNGKSILKYRTKNSYLTLLNTFIFYKATFPHTARRRYVELSSNAHSLFIHS